MHLLSLKQNDLHNIAYKINIKIMKIFIDFYIKAVEIYRYIDSQSIKTWVIEI